MSSSTQDDEVQASQEIELQTPNGHIPPDPAPAAARSRDQETTPGEIKSVIKKIEDKLQRLVKCAFVLANLYYFFQGTVLTAVSQVSSPKCHQKYFFFALSIISFLVNGVPLIYVARDYVKVRIKRDSYRLERERSRKDEQRRGDEVTEDAYRKVLYYFWLVFAVFWMVVCNGAVLFACNSLLCDHNPIPPIVDYDDGCFRICSDENKCLKICNFQIWR